MRASQVLKAKRLNHARSLLQRCPHLPDAVAHMMRDSALSPRQAYRYLEQARRLKQPVPIGDPKIAFTVKLSRKLVEQVRTRAQEAGHTTNVNSSSSWCPVISQHPAVGKLMPVIMN